MRHHKTEAVILSTLDIFDTDRSLLLFSFAFGKLRARARGVRKPTSRLTGHLLLYLPTQLELVENNGNYTVAQAQIVQSEDMTYPSNPLLFLQQAEMIGETLNRLFPEHEAHPDIYEGLIYSLTRLRYWSNLGNGLKSQLVAAEFVLKCLGALGYQPQLQECVLSGQPLNPEGLLWSSQVGGLINREALSGAAAAGGLQPVSDSRSIVVLRQFIQPRFMAELLNMPLEVQVEACRLIYDYVQTTIGQPLRALGSGV